MEDAQKGLQGLLGCRAEQLGGDCIWSAGFIWEALEGFAQLFEGERWELGCLLLGGLLQWKSCHWLVIFGWLPQGVPGLHPVSHTISHWNVPVWSLPRQLTGFERAKQPSKALGFPLPDPFCILEAGLFAALGLGCFKLVLYRLFHQLESAVIPVLQPMLLCIQKLCPCLVTKPLVLHLVKCCVEPLDGSWCFGGLVLDEVEAGLDLFPVGCFPFLPNAACLGRDQRLVLCGEVGCSSLWTP